MNVISSPGSRNCAANTLVHLVIERARRAENKQVLVYLENGVSESASLTYGQLDVRARALGARLQQSYAPGARALLLFPPGLDFVVAFFACLYAGIVAVPAYPPKRNQKALRLQAILDNAQPSVILATAMIVERMNSDPCHVETFGHVDKLASDEVAPSEAANWRTHLPAETDLAFLQYTSGSTATPKGVMVSHANLMANSAYIRDAFGLSAEETVSVSWLPSYHDMGLIDGILQPIYSGFTGYLMPSALFFQQPVLWLQAISRFRATHSGGPDFAYTLCARNITLEQREQLDLSCWTTAYNGAEPVRAATLDLFTATFAPQGFRNNFHYPCYGMAETTLMVTGVALNNTPPRCTVDAAQLERGLAYDAVATTARCTTLVSSGHVFGDTKVMIVDPATGTALPDSHVGEIWVAGSSVARGYWNNKEQTATTFAARISGNEAEPFLRTGDLGFLRAGELYVTGRLKDVIIVHGRNHYPHDLERTAERSHAGLRPSNNAAFTIDDDNEERLVIIQEVERTQVRRLDGAALATAISAAVQAEHGIRVYAVAFLLPGRISKTSSGKIQRQACRRAFQDGTLDALEIRYLDDEPAVATNMRDELAGLQAGERHARIALYLREVVGALLAVPALQVPLDSSVIELGLDSLGMVQLRQRLRAALGYDATDLPQGTSLRALADRVAEHGSAESLMPADGALPAPLAGPVSLSRGQEAIWFLHQLAPDGAAYNIAFAADIASPVDSELFGQALAAVVARHDALRTGIIVEDGKPFQQVRQRAAGTYAYVDATDWSDVDLDRELAVCAARPFDLREDDLLRVSLYRRGPAEHSLLIVAHHIIIDFRSMEILLDELTATYAALQAGLQPRWAPMPLQQRDFVREQARMLASPAGAVHAAYWVAQLTGVQSALALPYDAAKRVPLSTAGQVLRLQLPPALSMQLRAFAREHGITPYTLLLAAFKIQLFRYTAQSELCVGTSVDQRSGQGFERTVGYLVNQVALRSCLDAGESAAGLLDRLSATCRDAWQHQDYPLATLVEQLNPARADSRSPLFDVMFGYLRATRASALGRLATQLPGVEADRNGLSLRSRPLERHATQFDLMLTVIDAGEHLTACWEFDTGLFHSATIERMHGHYATLLQSVIDMPSTPIALLPLLTSAERHDLLVRWNGQPMSVPPDARVHTHIEAQAVCTPTAAAVVDGDGVLSYEELNRRANRLAGHLRERGIGPTALVGICVRRSSNMLVALLAVLKTGAAYVPLDPALPDQRLCHILRDADVTALITAGSTTTRCGDAVRNVICIDTQAGSIALQPDANLDIVTSGDALAYVMYTSGSTGVPKGVMVTHAGLMNYLWWCTDAYAVAHADGAPVNSSLGFDATITSLIAPLLAGRKVVLLPEEDELAALSAALRGRDQFSVVKITPAHLEILKSYFPPGSASVRTNAFIVGGEALPAPTVRYWREHSPGTRIINEYGPTETVVGCCVYDAVGLDAGTAGVPIGRPIANTAMYILDAARQLVPVGIIGEIHIAGAGVARGYLNRPDLTRERFVPDPFDADSDARMYCTGDLARWLPDGNIEYVGRNDSQVKVRGFRIELGEIEAALLKQLGVAEAAVTLHNDERGNKQLVAHLVCDDGSDAQARLRTALAAELPAYMLPALWNFVERMPLTPNGKIDRKALAMHELPVQHANAIATQLASSPLEQTIAAVWSDALGRGEVGVHDNFFDAGGHSLLAARVHQRLVELLGNVVTIIDIYHHPTISSLARYLSNANVATALTAEQQRGRDRRTRQLRQRGTSAAQAVEPC